MIEPKIVAVRQCDGENKPASRESPHGDQRAPMGTRGQRGPAMQALPASGPSPTTVDLRTASIKGGAPLAKVELRQRGSVELGPGTSA